MPLPTPRLDDRTFDDLVEEALRRIPTVIPEWTDVNVSDPGVALIELFAHVAETIIARLNRLPEKAFVEFLNLVGIEPIPATPAKATLRFTLVQALDYPVTIPAGTEVSTITRVAEEPVVYATDADLTIPAGALTGEVSATARVQGSAGRVGANALVVLRTPIPYVDSVTNPEPSQGGIDAETVEQAMARAPQAIKALDRAAAKEDYETLALQASADVLRAYALERYDPTYPGQESLGHVTVAILAREGEPDVTLINLVRDYLDRRDYAGARVHVKGPQFVDVDVTVTIAVEPGYVAASVASAVQQAIAAWLDPATWPWGRDVYLSNLQAVIESVDGVDYVVALDAPTATVEVPPDGLARAGTITVTTA